MKQLITDDVLQAAFDYLHESSDNVASARANLIKAEYEVKRVYGHLFLHGEGTVETRKSRAFCHPDYIKATDDLAIAEGTWEMVKDQRSKAEMIISAWQTEQATRRVVDRIR